MDPLISYIFIILGCCSNQCYKLFLLGVHLVFKRQEIGILSVGFFMTIQEDPEVIGAWFKLVKETMIKYSVDTDNIYNFGKTGFHMGIIGSIKIVTDAERRTQPDLIQLGNCE